MARTWAWTNCLMPKEQDTPSPSKNCLRRSNKQPQNSVNRSFITKLPAKILLNIFITAQCSCSCPYNCGLSKQVCVGPRIVASVCKDWRNVSLASVRLWSHVHLIVQPVTGLAWQARYIQLLDQWSATTTINLIISIETCISPSILVAENHLGDVVLVPRSAKTNTVLAAAAPLTSQARTLEVHSEHMYTSDLRPILACMLGMCSSDILDMLVVHAHEALKNQAAFWEPSCLLRSTSTFDIHEMTKSLRGLYLSESFIHWSNNAYYNLTELSLSARSGLPIGITQLRDILSHGPKLHLLRMKFMWISQLDETPGEPIYLNQLQTLVLTCNAHTRFSPILQLLRLKSENVAIRMNVADSPQFITDMHRFFINSKISTIHIVPQNRRVWFSVILQHLSQISVMTLEQCSSDDLDFKRFVGEIDFSLRHKPWPLLHTLRLKSCLVELRLLKLLVELTEANNLLLLGCTIINSDSNIPVHLKLPIVEEVLSGMNANIIVEHMTPADNTWWSHWIW